MKTFCFVRRAACIATLTTVSFSASALEVLIGDVIAGSSFAQVIQKGIGEFSDKWTFTIVSPTFAGGSVSNLAISVPGFGSLYNIGGLSAQLYTGGNLLIDNLDDNPGSTVDIKVGSGLFPPGNYYFNISGTGNGQFGGQYVFSVTTLAPIPEPESYAMLLAGLGVMGAIAMRRNKSKNT